ncbi:hypothetical protein [Limnofasciculus baicalensis]|uniref:ATP-binding protein n=1 Tax=Limnofasciculus baicalensis BBK-W-15 TaxID=2699891 RepID=A0AAE3GWJ4_9CYAN|nr:hypothetical protein [Limnofasciculus baicalensis]MCP2729892.1 hypothetical protein [Limnofasciculus baicalensis BBK-W-15]
MKKTLSEYFSLNRRYSRSINLERDIESIEALEGYVPTTRSLDALRRILAGLTNPQANRAWTLTSVYGTGKSAFAHYLSSLCTNVNHPMRQGSLEITRNSLGADSYEYQSFIKNIPSQGLFCAVVTAQREPIGNTIVRALARGAKLFWSPAEHVKIDVARQLVDLKIEIDSGKTIDNRQIIKLVQEVARAAETDVFIIIDELGKNLEFAAYNEGAEDLYLLQQLTELPRDKHYQVYLMGILHQAFTEYGQRLASVERNEWAKIQGRFEDIPFSESVGQMIRLMGQAINCTEAEFLRQAIYNQVTKWFDIIENIAKFDELKAEDLGAVYPLHPVAALVLPILCGKYGQNDRSLFTFLTSSEPYSFRNFLKEEIVNEQVPVMLKLDRVYDYFVEAVGMGFGSRPNLQRWVEIQNLIADAKHLDEDYLRVLKTIGTLNLVTTTGAVKATRELVILAMCDSPTDEEKRQKWEDIIDRLLKRNIITHRRLLNELRLWEGSDFNIEGEVAYYIEQERSSLAKLLSENYPLKPLVAQRHSYKTGTLRYFERRYIDDLKELTKLRCNSNDTDGLIVYWLDDQLPTQAPINTADSKPLIVLCGSKLSVVRIRTLEFTALQKIQTNAAQLQTDAVARRELQYRLFHTKQLLDESLNQAFDVAINHNVCWIQGKRETILHGTEFNGKLSEVCDNVYQKTPILWNELINRRELTSQGAKARRELIEVMLANSDLERLGLEGYGPSVCMYYSLLEETKIHREEEGEWGFYPPDKKSGLCTLWQAIEEFCLQAKEKQKTLDRLYQILESPPYGVKSGAIPVLLAAVLLYRVDDVGIYKDGTFIPVLGAEHFELLVKEPSRFSVKYFAVAGVRSQVFKELEAILKSPNSRMPVGVRNTTLLAVTKPLFQFVKKLPAYTLKTKRLSKEAQGVLQTLQQAQEPDELLFTSLPQACGLPPIGTGEEGNDSEAGSAASEYGLMAKTLRKKLVEALNEIQTAYDLLLNECQTHLQDAFGVRTSDAKLREDLRVRSRYLVGQCVERMLKSFTLAATDETKTDREWLEALVMIVADKPAESWTDENLTIFEIKLTDLARRFKNLEALQKEVTAKGEGFEVCRITVTRPDGKETNQMVWIEREYQDPIDDLVEKVLQEPLLLDNAQLQQAFVAKLTERVLGKESQDNVTQLRRKDRDDNAEINHA